MRKSRGPGGLVLEHPELDLRPRQELVLQSVCIKVLDPGAESVSVEWNVTAKNADEKLEGQLSVAVAGSTLNISGIDCDAWEAD